MDSLSNKHLLKIKKSLLKKVKYWAGTLFVIELLILFIIDYILPNHHTILDFINNNTLLNNFVDTIKSLIIEILPITAITIFIQPVLEQFNKIEKIIENEEQRKFFSQELLPLKSHINDINNTLNSFVKYKEIYSIDYSYNETDWASLLSNSTTVTMCMLYTGTHWNRKYLSYFEDYVKKGGKLKIFLPNASEVKSRFFQTTSMSKATSDKIYRTINIFRKINYNNNIEIKVLNKGFHYMFARIEKKDYNIFLFSPYSNNYNRSEAPVIAFNEKYINQDMRNFIDKEIEYLTEDSAIFPDFESEKYIVWRTNRNKVFISVDLFCPEKCKFCYVDSLIDKKYRHNSVRIAKMICEVVRNDERFVKGRFGTNIMLSSFCDPFHKNNIESTIEIINFFSISQNFIDIATRFPLQNIKNVFQGTNNNILINFSLSTFNSNVEVDNQIARFENAKLLISQGYNVALYLRPIIQNVTIKDLDKIIKFAKDSGIQVITIGGLYVEQTIIDKLLKLNIDVSKCKTINKQFILDDKNILQKLEIEDINIIEKKLLNEGFIVFHSSDERIEYFKNKI